MVQFTEPLKASLLLKDFPCKWGVAGGWAIDLFLDRVTRVHQDVEVAIFRDNQLTLQEYLSARDWSFEAVSAGRLQQWLIGERVSLPIHELQCRNFTGRFSHLEVLLNERSRTEFIFRRDSRIRRAVERTFLQTARGIPILAPEIVLLYKSKHAGEPKEKSDFANALPSLDKEQRRWLRESLATTNPGHAWLADFTTRT